MVTFQRPEMLVLMFAALIPLYTAYRNSDRYRRTVSILHLAVVVLLAFAAASPSIATQEKRSSQAQVTVLEDGSLSTSFMKYDGLNLEDVNTRQKKIASGNSSKLASGIMRNLEEDGSYLVVSDLQADGDLSKVFQKADKLNATLKLLKPDMKPEKSVSIQGPSSTVPGVENSYAVQLGSTTDEPGRVTLKKDSKTVFSGPVNGSTEFNLSFDTKGTHVLEASLDSNDRWSRNNRFHMAVDVTEKPEILVVGEKGDLGRKLERFYDVTYSSRPEKLDRYYAVIMKKDAGLDSLESYVAEGNGLVYTGDYSTGSGMLPVRKTEGSENQNTRIVLLIDISKSTEKNIDRSKDIAYALADELPSNAKVGAIAYSRTPYVISKPRILAYNRQNLREKISRLPTKTLSYHDRGLKAAKQMTDGKGNVIMLTDGKFSSGVKVRPRDTVVAESLSTAASMDARLFTLGVGDSPNTGFLRNIAREADGFYRSAETAGQLSFVFQSGGGAGSVLNMVNANPEHFITSGLKVDGQLALYDPVSVRKGGNVLVASASGNPVLTTWRYGIGRVAAFSADSRDLEGILSEEPALAARTVSWAVGSPRRKQDRWISIGSARKGEKVHVKASFPVEGLKRQGDQLYTGELSPEETGIHRFAGKGYAYNYRGELQDLGYNRDNVKMFADHGGVYRPDETSKIASDVRNLSEKKVSARRSLSPYLLLLAALFFLVEVGYRKRSGKR